MLRMRTIDQAHAHIKALDPDSALTKYALRQMVITGEITAHKAGNKYLINLDTLEAYLSTAYSTPPTKCTSGQIRPVGA